MIRSEAPLQIVAQPESKSCLGAQQQNSGQDIFMCIALSPESDDPESDDPKSDGFQSGMAGNLVNLCKFSVYYLPM